MLYFEEIFKYSSQPHSSKFGFRVKVGVIFTKKNWPQSHRVTELQTPKGNQYTGG